MQRVLIANRGEVAARILRACRAAELEAVAAYSTADRDTPARRPTPDDRRKIG